MSTVLTKTILQSMHSKNLTSTEQLRIYIFPNLMLKYFVKHSPTLGLLFGIIYPIMKNRKHILFLSCDSI